MRCTKCFGSLIAIAMLCVQAGLARAAPESGVWFNPNEAGRGFAIEIQGSALFMGAFLYEADGRSTWYASGGPLQADGSYQGTLQTYGNGPTLTGAYKPNAVTNPNAGNISLQFSDATHGTIIWPGGTIPIQRYVFGSGTPSFKPETGLWWNTAENGRGFLIELQGTDLFFGGYMYDEAGNPVWYDASGPMTSTTLFNGNWSQYSGGQTMTGAYRPPGSPVSVGSVTLQFTSATRATLTLPDARQIPLTRFYFSPPGGTRNATTDELFLAPADPLNVAVTTDATLAVIQVVTPAGGTLTATDAAGNRFTLEIPANALKQDTTIKMEPISEMPGLPFAPAKIIGVQLAPDGLYLEKTAMLTIDPAQAVAANSQVHFGYLGSGNDVHVAIPGLDPARIQIPIIHFSGWGIFDFLSPTGSAQARTALALKRAAEHEVRLAQLAGITILEIKTGEILVGDPGAAIRNGDFTTGYFESYYYLVLRPRLLAAATSCANAHLAYITLVRLEQMLQQLGGAGRADFDDNLAMLLEVFADLGKVHPCIYQGKVDNFGGRLEAHANISWVRDGTVNNVATYRPGINSRAWTGYIPPKKCTLKGQDQGVIDPSSSYLIVDYNTEPPSYRGMGISTWSLDFNCPGPPAFFAVLPAIVLLFGADSEVQGTVALGKVEGTSTAGNLTTNWNYKACSPSFQTGGC